MAIYKVKAPDGSIIQVRGPDGASDDEVMAQAKRLYSEQNAAPAPQPEAPAQPEKAPAPELSVQNGLKAAGDVIGTVATGAIAEPISGIAGALTALATRDSSTANAAVEKTREFLTYSPKSEAGKYTFEQLGQVAEKAAPAFQWIDDKINQLSGGSDTETGNVAVATALKTALYGTASLVGIGKAKALGSTLEEARVAGKTASAAATAAKKAGEKLGIRYTNNELPSSLIDAADRLIPDTRKALDMGDVQTAVKTQAAADKDAVDRLYAVARNKRAFVDVNPIQAVAHISQRDFLAKGLDLREMPKVRARLQQIADMDKVLPGSAQEQAMAMGQAVASPGVRIKSVGLKNMEIMDKRLTEDLAGAKPREFTAEQKALYDLRSNLRNTMDEQFDQGLIKGDQTAIQAFKDAKTAYTQYKKNFNSNRIIRNMLAEDASPEKMYQWVIGASANGMKKEAATTVARLKRILGDNHPAIMTMKMAVIRDTLEPLLNVTNDTAAFRNAAKTTVKRVDKLLSENYSTVKELGLDAEELGAIRKAAYIAQHAAEPLKIDIAKPFAAFVVREAVGNKLAKSSAWLRLTTAGVNKLFGLDHLKMRDINKMLMDQPYDKPMVIPGMPGYGRVVKDIAVAGARADATNFYDGNTESE